MKSLHLFIFLVLCSSSMLFACSENATDINEASDSESVINTALSTITRDNIQSSLDYLASDERAGRLTGSLGYDDAAKYVSDQFEAIGLEPGGAEGWYQQVPIITRLIDSENSGAILHKNTGDVALKWNEGVSIYADRLRDDTRVKAEVVFVGFGVHSPENDYSDYDDIDVEGKIVAFFRGAPASFPSTERAHFSSGRTKTTELVGRGAIGSIQLGTSPWSPDPERRPSTQPSMSWVHEADGVADYHPEIKGEAFFNKPIAEQLFEGVSLTLADAKDAADNARSASTALGIEVTLFGKTVHERISSPNVIGVLRGSDPELSKEYIVYSTHLDHLGTDAAIEGDGIYNGLYDNAIGVSMTIEMARALAALPVAPKRSIMFVAVTGEEEGLMGSDYFVHYPTVPASALVANVNIDMPMVIFPLNTFTGYGAEHSSLEALAIVEARKEGFEYMADPYPEEVYFIRSDQYSFVRGGIPAVYFAEGIGSSDPDVDGRAVLDAFFATHYHEPTDDLSQPINWETALRFTRGGARIGYSIAMKQERPEWKEGNFFGEKFGK